MDSLMVSAESKEYPIYFTSDFSGLCDACEEAGLKKTKAFIVADSNVSGIYMADVKKALEGYFAEVCEIVFDAGEKNKNMDTMCFLYSRLLEERAERKSTVFALGGGVCGDLVGFSCSGWRCNRRYDRLCCSNISSRNQVCADTYKPSCTG